MSKQIKDPSQIEAVVFGYLVKEFGKVQIAKFNKLTEPLGLDKINIDRLKELAQEIKEDETLSELVDGAIEGKYTLEDLVHVNSHDKTPHEDIDPYDVLSTYSPQHERVLEANRTFNRVQKNGSYLFNLMEDLKKDTYNEFKNNLEPLKWEKDKDFKTKLEGSSLIVTVADIHVGALSDVGYKYNFQILLDRLKKYIEEVKTVLDTIPGIDNIRVYVLGDSVEQFYMRNQQSFEAEFPLSEQIAKAKRVISNFVAEMQKLRPVKFGIVQGNHDRLSPDKKENVYNDSVSYVILDSLMHLQELGHFQNVEFIDNRKHQNNFMDTVNGKNILVLHGDQGIKKGKGTKISGFIKDKPIDYMLSGHFHSLKIEQEDFDRLWIQVSSIMGYNTYSDSLNLPYTKPSQTLIVLNENLEGPFIYPVFFD